MIDFNIVAQMGVGGFGMWLMYTLLKNELTILRAQNNTQTENQIKILELLNTITINIKSKDWRDKK